ARAPLGAVAAAIPATAHKRATDALEINIVITPLRGRMSVTTGRTVYAHVHLIGRRPERQLDLGPTARVFTKYWTKVQYSCSAPVALKKRPPEKRQRALVTFARSHARTLRRAVSNNRS